MRKERDNFRLGLAVIVMFVLFFACLLFIGGEGLFRAETREFRVRFSAGPGMPEIVPGSRVVCFGQAVGEVVETHFTTPAAGATDGAEPQYLEVRATALAALDLRADCAVIASGPPLGGKGMLEIANRGVSASALSPDTPVVGQSAGFQTALTQLNSELDASNPSGLLSLLKQQLDVSDRHSLLAKIHTSLGDINTMTANLSRELDRAQEDALLQAVHSGLTKINLGLSELVGILQENRPRIDSTLTSVDHAMQVVDGEIVRNLADEMNAAHEGALLAEVHAAFVRLNTSLADLNTITGETKRVVVLNSGRLDELMQNVTQASILLKNGIKDVVLHPWKAFFQPSADEKRELHVLGIAREFAEASAHLDDSTTRLKALLDAHEGTLAPDDADLRAIREELGKSVEQFFSAERALWQELDVK